MTRQERRKLAKAARELAMECVAGTAQEFEEVTTFHADGSPGCVLGHLYSRAGISRERWLRCGGTGAMVDHNLEAPVWQANDSSLPAERHAAVVFPLLALADELESAS